jgi:di/tripeptidase
MTTTKEAAGLVELRQKLPGVSCSAFQGDNLAIFLASEFEPGVESDETDESGTWKQGAIDLADEVLDAIHAHYATTITNLLAQVEELRRERDEARREATTAITTLSADRNSWRRVAEQFHGEKQAAESRATTAEALVAELAEAAQAIRASRGGTMALSATDTRTVRLWAALAAAFIQRAKESRT